MKKSQSKHTNVFQSLHLYETKMPTLEIAILVLISLANVAWWDASKRWELGESLKYSQ